MCKYTCIEKINMWRRLVNNCDAKCQLQSSWRLIIAPNHHEKKLQEV